MKKILIFLTMLIFASCTSKIVIKISKTQETFLDLDIKPSDSTKKIVKSLYSMSKDGQEDTQDKTLENVVLEGGIEIVSFKMNQNFGASAKVKFLTNSKEIDSQIFNVKKEDALILSLNKEKLKSIFSGIGEEAKGYLELLMAPSMQENDMSTSEYMSLIASSYGKKVAGELKNSRVELHIEVPNKIKNVSISPKSEYSINDNVLELSLPLIHLLVMEEPILINVEYPN